MEEEERLLMERMQREILEKLDILEAVLQTQAQNIRSILPKIQTLLPFHTPQAETTGHP